MAILKNLDKAIHGQEFVQITVGNNRTIEHIGKGVHLCRLHGHIVARVESIPSGFAKVGLDTCGYMTPTTRQAMGDFMRAFGIVAGVSVAKGVLSVGWMDVGDQWIEKDSHANNNSYVSFMAPRYP